MFSFTRLILTFIVGTTLIAFTLPGVADKPSHVSQNMYVEHEDLNRTDSKEFYLNNCFKNSTKNVLDENIIVANREPNCCGQCTVSGTGQRGCLMGLDGNTYCSAC